MLLIYNPYKKKTPKCIRRWKFQFDRIAQVISSRFFYYSVSDFWKEVRERLFLYSSSKRVKYLWAERLFSRYLVQLLLRVAVTVAEFLHWWQLNNTSAICPWMELALNFNSPSKEIDPCCLYAHRFTNQVIWPGKDWWHGYNQKETGTATHLYSFTWWHIFTLSVLLMWNPANLPFSMTQTSVLSLGGNSNC